MSERPPLVVLAGGNEADSYESAALEDSLKWARWMLLRLYGVDGWRLEEIEVSACDQCHASAPEIEVRWRYGPFALCRKCASQRLRLTRELAD
jgi:hypothetical protein